MFRKTHFYCTNAFFVEKVEKQKQKKKNTVTSQTFLKGVCLELTLLLKVLHPSRGAESTGLLC